MRMIRDSESHCHGHHNVVYAEVPSESDQSSQIINIVKERAEEAPIVPKEIDNE
jgi:hypothetical protein